jgi:hypothetical protein
MFSNDGLGIQGRVDGQQSGQAWAAKWAGMGMCFTSFGFIGPFPSFNNFSCPVNAPLLPLLLLLLSEDIFSPCIFLP